MDLDRVEEKSVRLELCSEVSEEREGLEDFSVAYILVPRLELEQGGGEKRKVEIPRIRFVTENPDEGEPRPFGPDRALCWKKIGEWLQSIFVDSHPGIREKRYENRVQAERSYLYGDEDYEPERWQEDEVALKEIRPLYEDVRKGLIERIGRPTREDFGKLYPHNYDDPGLSERARRAVRDLKAVFGSDVLKST